MHTLARTCGPPLAFHGYSAGILSSSPVPVNNTGAPGQAATAASHQQRGSGSSSVGGCIFCRSAECRRLYILSMCRAKQPHRLEYPECPIILSLVSSAVVCSRRRSQSQARGPIVGMPPERLCQCGPPLPRGTHHTRHRKAPALVRVFQEIIHHPKGESVEDEG